MYNFILLLEENSHSNTFSLVEQKPSHVPIPSIEIIQSLCFSQKFQKNNEKRNIVYMFNTEEHYCYTYSFVFSNKRYSIVILSSYFKPNLFLKFLEAVSDSFNEIDILNNVNDNSKIENNKLCECSSDDFIIIINQNDDDNSNISPNFTQNSQNSEYSNSNNDLYNNKKK
ncbi:hypothetical protein TRFO_28688 [Tritrichomonas foetus]|uniref:Uncharacterized protein n=1 Tax=Tritrichomonas foetus TaxID=1144522 RepID=A0A1J4JXS1_9EUKA|nr:hypothetical protein TRFO_28688 [Tritrichomonas foetus]|eukprot:OHT03959.1 hypothetical protein TRFO_28688 [Tritrichomonas foetus]